MEVSNGNAEFMSQVCRRYGPRLILKNIISAEIFFCRTQKTHIMNKPLSNHNECVANRTKNKEKIFQKTLDTGKKVWYNTHANEAEHPVLTVPQKARPVDIIGLNAVLARPVACLSAYRLLCGVSSSRIIFLLKKQIRRCI